MNQTINSIVQQLGGNRFFVMTGSKIVSCTENSIRLKISSCKLTGFEVIYDAATDTYNVNLIVGRGVNSRLARDTIHDVYAEDLVPLFERETGLYTHL